MVFPKQIKNLIEAFQRLPGVGEKTAARLTFYLLHVPDEEINRLGESVLSLKKELFLCSICKNIADREICELCLDNSRDAKVVCVVESPLDVFSLESTGKFNGLYHVLHGLINPLHNIGPDELYIEDLIKRIADSGEQIEIILALNPTMEGEATAMYLAKRLKMISSSGTKNSKLKITRLGVGLPIGGDMQYADETTLTRALEGRRNYD